MGNGLMENQIQYDFGGKRYIYNGKKDNGLKRLVLAVVKHYVDKHPDITFDELLLKFPDKINDTRGVVKRKKYVDVKFPMVEMEKKRLKYNNPDFDYYFRNKDNNEVIEVKLPNSENKEDVVVAKDWFTGGNFSAFLKQCEKLGIVITQIETKEKTK